MINKQLKEAMPAVMANVKRELALKLVLALQVSKKK
jgi:hypothetical protein